MTSNHNLSFFFFSVIGTVSGSELQAPRFITQPSASGSIVAEGRTKILQCQALGKSSFVFFEFPAKKISTSRALIMIESLCLMSMGKYSKYILQCMWQEYGGGGFTFSKKKKFRV